MSPGLRAPVVTVLAGVGCAVVAGLRVGQEGVLGSAVGTALVLGFLWSGIVPLLLVRDGAAARAKGLATGILLLNYSLRLAVALAVLAVAGSSEALSHRALGVSVIVCATAWTAAQLVQGLGGEGHSDPA